MRADHLEIKLRLPGFVMRVDKMTMANEVSPVPFSITHLVSRQGLPRSRKV